jgi:hypothetical protein
MVKLDIFNAALSIISLPYGMDFAEELKASIAA